MVVTRRRLLRLTVKGEKLNRERAPWSYPLLDSARTSSGKRYSHPALPKLTRISFRPRFSTALTKVPSRGKRLPVFCDRIGLMVFNGSPGLIGTSGVSVTAGLAVVSSTSPV